MLISKLIGGLEPELLLISNLLIMVKIDKGDVLMAIQIIGGVDKLQ